MNTVCHLELDHTHALPVAEPRPAERWRRARLAGVVMLFLLLSLVIASLSAAARPMSALLILAAGASLVAGERTLCRPQRPARMDFYGLVELKDKWLA